MSVACHAVDTYAAFWHMARADVFVGSRSGFSWLVGLVATRPLVVQQHGAPSGMSEHCADTGYAAQGAVVCCLDDTCAAGTRDALRLALAHLVRTEPCRGGGQ